LFERENVIHHDIDKMRVLVFINDASDASDASDARVVVESVTNLWWSHRFDRFRATGRDGTGRVVDENDDDDDAICQRFCKHDDDDYGDEKQRAWTSRGTPGDARARGDEYWGVSGVFPARGGGTHGTGGD